MSNKNGTTVSLFVLKDYCCQCTHCGKSDCHRYQGKVFERWRCNLQARVDLKVRLDKKNKSQYAYTDTSAAFTFLNHNCPHFVMVSMESEKRPVGIDMIV